MRERANFASRSGSGFGVSMSLKLVTVNADMERECTAAGQYIERVGLVYSTPSKGSSMSSIRALGALVSIALVAALALGTAPSSAATPAVAKPCKVTARGVLWTFQGQTGVAYTIVGVNGASCPLASSWIARLSKQKGPILKGPAGWTCAGQRPSGACSKRAAVFTWSPKLRSR
jgi:hypothetical protein